MRGEEGEGVMRGWGERMRAKKKLSQWMTSDPQASVRGGATLQREGRNQISDWLGSSLSLRSDWKVPSEGPNFDEAKFRLKVKLGV